ncbi:lysylphosphatidylglycerol synthase domain-containing protein, partial [Frankia sp. CiP1_Cm_nod2]|uniref:lysylphosphatidylglycerol synthase domain-containing protein n=1 Tax=Frankia sp. CiP1_Cm_nod2 TaxID=2897161 RepID=UPI00404457B6
HYGLVLLAVPVFAAVLYPPVLSALLASAFRLLRRPPLEQPPGGRHVLAAAGWLLAGFVLYGVATWLLARDLTPSVHGVRLLLLSVGGYSFAWTAGFLVLVLPAGAGVREAVLVLTLAPALAAGPATVLALIIRLFATVADLVWAGIGMALRPTPTGVPTGRTAPPDAVPSRPEQAVHP